MLFNLSSQTALLLGMLILFLLVKNSLLLGMLFQFFSSITLRLGLLLYFFLGISLLLGMLSCFFFVPPQVGGLTHVKAVVMYFSTGASAAISA